MLYNILLHILGINICSVRKNAVTLKAKDNI